MVFSGTLPSMAVNLAFLVAKNVQVPSLILVNLAWMDSIGDLVLIKLKEEDVLHAI
jgi:hypothetical protein